MSLSPYCRGEKLRPGGEGLALGLVRNAVIPLVKLLRSDLQPVSSCWRERAFQKPQELEGRGWGQPLAPSASNLLFFSFCTIDCIICCRLSLLLSSCLVPTLIYTRSSFSSSTFAFGTRRLFFFFAARKTLLVFLQRWGGFYLPVESH